MSILDDYEINFEKVLNYWMANISVKYKYQEKCALTVYRNVYNSEFVYLIKYPTNIRVQEIKEFYSLEEVPKKYLKFFKALKKEYEDFEVSLLCI